MAYLDDISCLINTYLEHYADKEERQRLEVLLRQVDEGDAELTSRKNMVGHLTASALVLDRQNRVLLIKHNMLNRWLQPGGHIDWQEAPLKASVRELSEETGIAGQDCSLVKGYPAAALQSACAEELAAFVFHQDIQPIDIDSHVIPENPDKGEGRHLHHDFQFVYKLENDKAELNLQQEEVSHFRWVDLDTLVTKEYGVRLARVAAKIKENSRV